MENHKQPFTEQELSYLYSFLESPLSKSDIYDIAFDIQDTPQYRRTLHSATITLTVMHLLIHDELPDGVKPSEGYRQKPMKPMMNFLRDLGYDVDLHWDNQVQRSLSLADKKSKKVKREQAKRMMVVYYNENKKDLPLEIPNHRESIIQKIMQGQPLEQAFQI